MPTPEEIAASVKVWPSIEQVSSLHDLPPCPPPGGSTGKPVAVLICHGMGQQVPFETLSAIAGLLGQPVAGGPAPSPPVVRHVQFHDAQNPKQSKWLPRAELCVSSPDGTQTREVHVYEAYWAPLTEGRIALSEVIRFLAVAGWQGLWLRYFRRWLFDRFETYDRPLSTLVGLLLTLAVVAALVVINTVLTLVVGGNALGVTQTAAPEAASAAAASHMLTFQLTTDLFWLLLTLVVAYLPFKWSTSRWERAVAATPPERITRGLPDYLTIGGLGLLGLSMLLTAAMMAGQYLWLRQGTAAHLANVYTLFPGPRTGAAYQHLAQGVSWWLLLPVWGAVLAASYFARGFFVQYLGDVAIYIDSHKVDKFHEIREQIKQMALETACTIYGARQASPAHGAPLPTPTPFAYDQVVLAGHSLGSVVTYDALNATLNLDDALGNKLCVAQRTGSLITYGSPLDKIAFIFNSQLPDALLRVGLTSSVQPLIRSLYIRSSIHWVNIYAGMDIVSGALDFFQLPKPPAAPLAAPPVLTETEQSMADLQKACEVENICDTMAVTPIQAHTQYWRNPLLAEQLRKSIFRPDALR